MHRMRNHYEKAKCCIGRFWRESSAVSTVEYALIVVAVIAIIGVAAGALSGAFNELFQDLTDQINTAVAETTNAAD